MKKAMSALLLLALTAVLAGCQAAPPEPTPAPTPDPAVQAAQARAELEQSLTDQLTALQGQLAQMQQELSALREQETVPVNSTEPQATQAAQAPATQAPQTAQAPATQAPQTAQSGGEQDQLADLADRIYDHEAQVRAAGDHADDMELYRTLRQENKQLDRELEALEDAWKLQRSQGTLSQDAYRELDRELELLEDNLDNSEDLLEYLFGIDD